MRPKCCRFLSLFILLTVISANTCLAAYCDRDLEAFPTGTLNYRSPGYAYYQSGSHGGYDKNIECLVSFKASYDKDVIKITFLDVDLQDRSRGLCMDKIIIYDGPSESSPVLKHFCGGDNPDVISTASSILLVFKTDNYDARNYRGFELEYSSLDRGGYEAYMDSHSTDAGIVAAAVIPSIIVYLVVAVVIYKRCKYAQRVRRNLAATGHTPDDLRVAMATMLDQANRGPLNIPRRPGGVQEELVNIMDQNAANRNSSSSASREPRRGRVRHPAGDIRTGPSDAHNARVPLTDSEMGEPYPDHDEGDLGNGYYYHPSNNNITTNNNTAANLNYPGYPTDPSGVYYAGNVDEHGMLHPANGGSPYYVPAGSVPHHANLSYLDIDDDRRSRSSGRSGRNSPRRSGRNSPRQRPGGAYNEPERGANTLTYYGMVDADRSGSGDIPSGTDRSADDSGAGAFNEDPPPFDELQPPPPSYEEAASGKYSPNQYS